MNACYVSVRCKTSDVMYDDDVMRCLQESMSEIGALRNQIGPIRSTQLYFVSFQVARCAFDVVELFRNKPQSSVFRDANWAFDITAVVLAEVRPPSFEIHRSRERSRAILAVCTY
jgi:hypothetical protein